jgi:hypothetical protein
MISGEMIPAGYLAKRSVKRPEQFGEKMPQVVDIFSVSSCVNDNFAEYVDFWKHNDYWFFDSPEIIQETCSERFIELSGCLLFFYEVYSLQFDGTTWIPFVFDSGLSTNVSKPAEKRIDGFDVVTYFAGNAPECSPLSCNGLAERIPTNPHCLLDTFNEAKQALESGSFSQSEPGRTELWQYTPLTGPGLCDGILTKPQHRMRNVRRLQLSGFFFRQFNAERRHRIVKVVRLCCAHNW